MIDPITALAGIQSAVKLIKQASKTVDDVASLGPLLGKYFDAKSNATKAVVESKKKGGSNMGNAIQIEMALEQAKEFEKNLQLLFMQAGKIDVWNRIKERAQLDDISDAHEARKAREAEKKRKEKEQEEMAWLIGGLAVVALLAFMAFALTELRDLCAHGKCGR